VTPRWVLIHATVVVLVVAFGLLCWWQVGRAASGNLLSFGYAVEWPAFAVFVVYVWIKEMRAALHREQPKQSEPAVSKDRARVQRPRNEAAYDESDDPELAAYNRYLAWLNANPHASRNEYPG
jgi:DNA-binding transcriptional regulator of glucitol operon